MIASIVKTIQLRAISATGDLTYAMAHLSIWWTLEAYLVILAASIPTLRPIMTTSRPSSNATTGSRQHNSNWRGNINPTSLFYNRQNRNIGKIFKSKLLDDTCSTWRKKQQIGENHHLEGGLHRGHGGIEKTTTIGIMYESEYTLDPVTPSTEFQHTLR